MIDFELWMWYFIFIFILFESKFILEIWDLKRNDLRNEFYFCMFMKEFTPWFKVSVMLNLNHGICQFMNL